MQVSQQMPFPSNELRSDMAASSFLSAATEKSRWVAGLDRGFPNGVPSSPAVSGRALNTPGPDAYLGTDIWSIRTSGWK